MDVPLPWERLLWSQRPLLRPLTRYALTDVRLVRLAGDNSDEVALADITDVQRRESWIDRILGTSTLVVHASDDQHPIVLPWVRRGIQVAALIELAGADPQAPWTPEIVRATLVREPRTRIAGSREAVLGVAGMIAVVMAVAVGLPGRSQTITYPFDDAIAPGGVKKDQASIVRFMESEVMPWARQALGPIVGGANRVTCETCHGPAAGARRWQMPAVATLPKPEVVMSGWEVYSRSMDAQMRNAIYGYAAESGNQSKASHMREAVMPGMARLLRRPAYDFTRSYEYNRTHAAFGCYHCHRVA